MIDLVRALGVVVFRLVDIGAYLVAWALLTWLLWNLARELALSWNAL